MVYYEFVVELNETQYVVYREIGKEVESARY